jgi:hypothetical protein
MAFSDDQILIVNEKEHDLLAEIPLIGRQGAVGLHVPLTRHEVELILCVGRVDHSKRNTMESCGITSL